MILEVEPLTDSEKVALGYCAPHGIPLSVFLGRVVYPGDPVWLERDAQAAVWWSQLCKDCGHHPDETFGPGQQDKWNAEMSGHCDTCRALNRAAIAADGRDDAVSPSVGARFRIWRDQEVSDGDVELAG